jgi:hypothetical protein
MSSALNGEIARTRWSRHLTPGKHERPLTDLRRLGEALGSMRRPPGEPLVQARVACAQR